MTFAQPFKDYEILDRIGSGAMGTVFKARHKSLNRIVALKVLRPSLARDQRYVNRLSREARIVAAFNHPNIVTGYDLGQEGGYHFFVMELVEGKSLRELLSEWGSFPEAQVLDTAIKIASALDHAYKKGIIHRDIKPGNILIDANNTVKLTDMGLAKGPADLTITREGATVGTPQYISPEQARDPQSVDVRSDLYSLGATLFHMCTGQPPFRAETMANVILKVINERAPSAREINPDVSEELSLVIRKLMAKDPDLRYQTPAELLTDLHRVQRDEQPDINLRQLEALDHVGGARQRWARVVGLAAVVTAVVTAGLFIWGDNAESRVPKVVAPSPDDDYRRELQEELAKPDWPAKLRALRSREAVANDWQRRILAPVRTRLEQDLRRELEDFLARQEVAVQKWILGWGAGSRFFRVELPDKLHQRFGLRRSGLPSKLRGVYDERVAGLQAKVPDLESQRERAYLARLDDIHQNLYATCQEYRERLEDRDFRGAERALLRTLRDLQGDGPDRAEMPQGLRQEVGRREKKVWTREIERIGREEQRVADKLRGRAGSVAEQVRQLLGGGATATNPRDARRKLADARRRLVAAFPPEYFRSESSPWPDVDASLDTAEREVELASTNYERELKRLAVRDAYRIAFADGRAGDAAAYLEGRELKVGEQELKQHIELLRHAEQAQGKLLAQLLERPGSRFKVERRPDGAETSVVLRRQEDGRLVMRSRRDVVSLATVNLPPLEQLAGTSFRDGLTADERMGLAVWYVLGGDLVQVGRLVPKGPRSEFLYRRLTLLAQELRKEELGPQMAATRLLEDAHKALKQGEWQRALETVQRIQQQHPAFYQSHVAEQERIKHEAEDGQLRARTLALMGAKAPPGAKVSMQGWQVSVDYPLDKVDLELQEGWRRSGQENGGVSFVRPAPALATARQSALVIKSLFAEDENDHVTVRVWLSFPEEGATPRLLLLRCHGVGVILGVVRDGALVAQGVKVGEFDDPRRLRKRMQPGLTAAADKRNLRFIEPDARHQLKLVVQRHGGRLRAQVYLDEDSRPLIPRFEVSGSHAAPELAVVAMHPLTVYAVRFEGEVRRDTRR